MSLRKAKVSSAKLKAGTLAAAGPRRRPHGRVGAHAAGDHGQHDHRESGS